MDKRWAALGQPAHSKQQEWSVSAVQSQLSLQSSLFTLFRESFVAFSVQTLHTQSFFCELIFGLKIIDGIIAGNSEGGAAARNS